MSNEQQVKTHEQTITSNWLFSINGWSVILWVSVSENRIVNSALLEINCGGKLFTVLVLISNPISRSYYSSSVYPLCLWSSELKMVSHLSWPCSSCIRKDLLIFVLTELANSHGIYAHDIVHVTDMRLDSVMPSQCLQAVCLKNASQIRKSCCAIVWTNTYWKKSDFFFFQTYKNQKVKWIAIIHWYNWNPGSETWICCGHLVSSVFNTNTMARCSLIKTG